MADSAAPPAEPYDSAMAVRRIAVFGGTFDPPHIGHLIVASEVRSVGAFDEVHLVVANDPWQKRGSRLISDAGIRLDLVRRAVAGHAGLVASDREVRRGGASYTIDTVESLLAIDPSIELSVVLGVDAASRLDTWHRSSELAELVEIVVVGRPGSPDVVALPGWRSTAIDVPAIAISSTEIRERVATGRPIDFLVTDDVRNAIQEYGLYGVAQ